MSVKVQTSNGRYLGETSFEYTDVINDVLQMMLRDRELQAIFFSRLAKDLARKTDETEREQTSSLKIAGEAVPSGAFAGSKSRKPPLSDLLKCQDLVAAYKSRTRGGLF